MKRMPSAKSLLKRVITPHTDLASHLLSKKKSKQDKLEISQLHAAAIVIFLSGVDKVLSLALQLLYLAGKVKWQWLAKDKSRHIPGVILCDRGFDSKLRKLQSIGLDLTELRWLAVLRNSYIHGVTIYAGYKIGIPERSELRFELRTHGPEISTIGAFQTGINARTIKKWATNITEAAGNFVDQAGWHKSWELIAKQIENLPCDPRPEVDQLKDIDFEGCDKIVTALNERVIGSGLTRLLGNQKI